MEGYVRDIWTWKGAAAAMLGVLEWLFGNPFSPEGKALALACVMMLLDLAFGTAAAVASRRWRFARLRQGLGKLMLWGGLLIVARRVGDPIGILLVDQVLGSTSVALLGYLILVDLASVLKHGAVLARVTGTKAPFLRRLADLVERAHAAEPHTNGNGKAAAVKTKGATP